jgi:hypothetical protein
MSPTSSKTEMDLRETSWMQFPVWPTLGAIWNDWARPGNHFSHAVFPVSLRSVPLWIASCSPTTR